MTESDVTVQRDFRLDGFNINNIQIDMSRIGETVTVGTTEIWNVTNSVNMPHSFHVHDVQFQLLSVGGAPPPAQLAG